MLLVAKLTLKRLYCLPSTLPVASGIADMSVLVFGIPLAKRNGFTKGDIVSSFENFARVVRRCASALSGVRLVDGISLLRKICRKDDTGTLLRKSEYEHRNK